VFFAYGKPERIEKTSGQHVIFGYDGMQNRISKATLQKMRFHFK
jgi:hypothetical protein